MENIISKFLIDWANFFLTMKVGYNIKRHVTASQFEHHILQLQISVAHLVLSFIMSRLWRSDRSQHNCDCGKKINDRVYFRLELSLTSGRCPQWFMFFKNLFYQNNCKVTMNIGAGKITGAFLNCFIVKKCSFCIFRMLPPVSKITLAWVKTWCLVLKSWLCN